MKEPTDLVGWVLELDYALKDDPSDAGFVKAARESLLKLAEALGGRRDLRHAVRAFKEAEEEWAPKLAEAARIRELEWDNEAMAERLAKLEGKENGR